MLNGSSKILRLATSWPPGAHLLNFPPPTENQNRNRIISVHFPSPPDHVLNLQPQRPQEGNPDNVRPREQAENAENNRIKFIKLSYLVASVYCVISALQMVIISLVFKTSVAEMVPGIICIFVALFALFLLSLLDKLRQILWMSILLSALFVQLVSVGLILVLNHKTPLMVALALVIAGIMLIVGYILGAFLPKVVLPGERFMLIFIIIFAVISVFLLTVHIFTGQLHYATAYFIVLLVVLIPVCSYHGQIVHGRRFKLPMYEFVFTATYIYMHFLLFFSSIFYTLWCLGFIKV